ncbi:hypothetical protein [Kitasatospora cheerisanensis]|uniref:hypothetical protein n=1 Tax=Kitasatospora cheerisanensis TaxID=81942 RepID=UPI001FCBC80B|nr:hypothetical protein [Kitasatospora cheerisanensis]
MVAEILSSRLSEPVSAEALWPAKFTATGVLLSADDGLDLPWTQTGTRHCSTLLTDGGAARQSVPALLPVAGRSLIGPAVDWLTAPEEELQARSIGLEIGPAAVDVLIDRIAQLRRLDDIQGGPLVLDWVTQDLHWAATLVRSGAYDNQTGVRLHEAFAELAQLAGWVATDLDRVALAQRYFLTGLRAAHTAGDRLLGANIVSCLSYQAAWHGPMMMPCGWSRWPEREPPATRAGLSKPCLPPVKPGRTRSSAT